MSRQLGDALAERELDSSPFQWERWSGYRTTTGERVPLLPGNIQHGLGRGSGSCSELPADAADIAAVLTRLSREGRDTRLTIIDWHKVAGNARFKPGSPALPPIVPEPQLAAVKDALHWSVSSSPEYRLFRQICAARDANPHVDLEDESEFWKSREIKRILRAMTTMPPAFSARAMRIALFAVILDEAFEDHPILLGRRPRVRRKAMVTMIRAAAAGWEDVGVSCLAAAEEEFAPRDAYAEDEWCRRYYGFAVDVPWPGLDPLDLLSRADREVLQAARHTVLSLALIGYLFLGHGMLMPDTPAQKELRDAAREAGVEHIATRVARSAKQTEGYAEAVVTCLHSGLINVTAELMELAGEAGPLFGDDPGKFDADWEGNLSLLRDRPPSDAVLAALREVFRPATMGFSTAAWLWFTAISLKPEAVGRRMALRYSSGSASVGFRPE